MEELKKQIEEIAPDFFRKKINVVKFYITEKCNLNCDFCLYRDRGVEEKKIDEIKQLLSFLDLKRVGSLILSGGEPTLRWDLLREVIDFVRLSFDGEIIVQTNGTLLNEERLDYFFNNNISIEFGFDGTLASMLHHRININDHSYERILSAIEMAVSKGITCWATMVVPPKQAYLLQSNFKALLDAGIPRADISPAIYEVWDEESCKLMKRGFVKLMEWLEKQDKVNCVSNYINKEVNKDELLLVITANLGVSLNYMNMCVPKKDRIKHNFLNLIDGTWEFDGKIFQDYLGRYNELFRIPDLRFKHILFYFGALAYQEIKRDLLWKNYVNVENFLAQTKKLYYLKRKQLVKQIE